VILVGVILGLTVPGLIAFWCVEVRGPRVHAKDVDAPCSCGCGPCLDGPHKASAHKNFGVR